MKDRGMMKWLPYKSLNEQSDFLKQMMDRKRKADKPLISSEKAEEIDRAMRLYSGGTANITYFDDGNVVTMQASGIRLDVHRKKAIIPDGPEIPFGDLVDFELLGEGHEAFPAD